VRLSNAGDDAPVVGRPLVGGGHELWLRAVRGEVGPARPAAVA
jgi:hypothetical protein